MKNTAEVSRDYILQQNKKRGHKIQKILSFSLFFISLSLVILGMVVLLNGERDDNNTFYASSIKKNIILKNSDDEYYLKDVIDKYYVNYESLLYGFTDHPSLTISSLRSTLVPPPKILFDMTNTPNNSKAAQKYDEENIKISSLPLFLSSINPTLLLVNNILPRIPTTIATLPTTEEPIDAPRTTCYQKYPQEQTLTSGNWWKRSRIKSRYKSLYEIFLNRTAFQPMFLSETIILGVLYSFSGNTIKLSAYFPPLFPQESRIATLVIVGQLTNRRRRSKCTITSNIWHCIFRISQVALDQPYTYQVRYRPIVNKNSLIFTYNGIIPIPVGYPRIAAVGCFGLDGKNDKTDLVSSIIATTPNILILNGDLTYQHDELVYGFMETLYSIQELTRNIPSIVQMDDHDYGQNNLMGAGNASEMSGLGFEKPACLINDMEELMLSHNPDPVSNSRLWNGLRARYTIYIYGQVEFAITEARKFKQSFWGERYKSSLLGQEQEEWLDEWCRHNQTNSNIVKVILAVTPFASLATHRTSYDSNYSVKPVTLGNRDANGYPLAGRTRAMKILHHCSHLVISGDQHLGIVVTYDDYGITDCASPAVLNSVFWRFNFHAPGSSCIDLWGNQYTLHNVWNVEKSIIEGYKLPRDTRYKTNTIKRGRADGFMTVVFDGNNAICAMHQYWLGHNVLWNVTVPV